MKNCMDCKSHVRVGGVRSCARGNQGLLEDWWEENKDKVVSEYENSVVDCYEPTEHAARLDKMIGLAEAVLEKLK